jgi:hypothetical protein
MNVSEQTNDLFILKSGNFKIMGMGIVDSYPKHKHVIVPIMVLLPRLGIR